MLNSFEEFSAEEKYSHLIEHIHKALEKAREPPKSKRTADSNNTKKKTQPGKTFIRTPKIQPYGGIKNVRKLAKIELQRIELLS